MTEFESLLLPLFVIVASIWLASMAYILVNRALYDGRHRRVRRLHDWLEKAGQTASAEERARLIERGLERLPRRTLERIAADTASPGWMAEAFAIYLVNRWGVQRWAKYARAHRREVGKWRRVAALRVLSHVRYQGLLPLLKRGLVDPDQDVVGAAIVILGGLGTREAAELLVGALPRQLHPLSRIATQLDQFQLPIVDQLLPLLKDSAPSVRFWAATLLCRYPESQGLDKNLAELADDPEPLVRKAAVETLGSIGGAAASGTAVKLLQDPVWYVRAHAARALGDLGRQDLAGKVVALLSDREWWVRTAAKQSLLAMGEGIWKEVVPVLDHPDRFARNGAAEVLQNIGWLDRIVEQVASGDREPQKLEILKKLFSAGGGGLVQSLAWHARELPGLAPMLESLGLEQAGSR